jgi:ribosome-binding factor A|tara:strand:- start:122 stop:472 length:351 start_codon:yes stop_codon:yes gene_type:complete
MSNQTRGGRINRINPLIQKIISEALLRNSDPLLNKATVTHVSTSPDLKKSLVFVSTLDGNEGSLKTSLEKNRNKIQKVIGREMTTKNVPKIIFEVDSTFSNVVRINELLDKASKDE